MKKNAFLINLSILMFTVISFFSFFLGNMHHLLVLSLIPISIYIFTVFISMDKENIAWIIFILFMWLSALLSPYSVLSYRFMMAFGIMFIAKLIFESIYGWQEKFSKILYACAFIHVAAIVLSLIFPNFIQSIVNNFYVGKEYEQYLSFYEYGAYAGLNQQTGYAAYFASVLMGFSVNSVICNNKRSKNYILTLVSVVAIFLTLKRSFLFSNAIAVLFCFAINNKSDKLNNIFKYFILIISAWFVISLVPETRNIFLKFERLLQGDVSNGRFLLWQKTIEQWKESPLFGLGINTLPQVHRITSHNVYLQLLAETGIFGMISFVIAVIMNFHKSVRIYADVIKDKTSTPLEKALFSTCIYMQIIFIIYCFTGNPLYDLNFLLIYIICTACIKSRRNKKEL